MQEDVTIRLMIDTGFSGSEHEKDIFIPRAQWDSWDGATREQQMQDELDAFRNDEITTDWKVVKFDADGEEIEED